jgi:hypothetical protein
MSRRQGLTRWVTAADASGGHGGVHLRECLTWGWCYADEVFLMPVF